MKEYIFDNKIKIVESEPTTEEDLKKHPQIIPFGKHYSVMVDNECKFKTLELVVAFKYLSYGLDITDDEDMLTIEDFEIIEK